MPTYLIVPEANVFERLEQVKGIEFPTDKDAKDAAAQHEGKVNIYKLLAIKTDVITYQFQDEEAFKAQK